MKHNPKIANACGEVFERFCRGAWAVNVACLSASLVILTAVLMVPAQTPSDPADSAGTKSKPDVSSAKTDKAQPSNPQTPDDKNKTTKKKKRGSIIIAPIPISSPAFGSGMLLVAGYVFKLNEEDKSSPPSWIGAAGAFTNNGTRAMAVGSRLYLKENKYQTTMAFLKGRANLDFFGIGRLPNRPPISVPLKMSGNILFLEGMRNVGGNIFVGPRYQHRRLTAGIEGPPHEGGFEIPSIDLKSTSAALGVHVQRDRRDSTFYPTKGSLFDFTADFFDQAWGSRREYQTYRIAYNGFREIKQKQVFAYRAMACSANGSVPFYDLCLYGFNSDIRGYTTGEFQNRRMFATQAEYRIEWRKRLGFAAFGGLGGIAKKWGDFRSDQLLPGGGVGLRFNLDKKNHINYRVDLAFGRAGRTLSIGVGEAF
jgi:Omp85 superfamily domain